MTPFPARFIANASPASSGSSALRLGVGRPSAARCLVVREVVNPNAPALRASSSSLPISSISAAVGCSR